MLSLGSVRIFLHRKPMDMRCGFERLSLVVEEEHPGELWEAAYFVFLNEKRTLMKVLYWDREGLAIWAKRLEMGTFGWTESVGEIDRRQFLMMLEGIQPKRLSKRFERTK